MQGYIFDRRDRHEWMPLESDGAVPDESVAVAVVAGQMKPFGRLSEPKSVVRGCTGAAEPAVMPDRGAEGRVAVRQGENPAPGLGDAELFEPQQVPA